MFVDNIAELSRRATIAVLSLPDGSASQSVCTAIAQTPRRRVTHVLDTSTVGLDASRSIAAFLAAHNVGYIDAPVSGGVAGARARTLAVMYSGHPDDCLAVAEVIAGVSDRRFLGRRRTGNGPSSQTRQQLPVRHGAGRHERGGSDGNLRWRDNGDAARGDQRIERTKCGQHRQVRQPRPDRALLLRLPQHPDGQRRRPLPPSSAFPKDLPHASAT